MARLTIICISCVIVSLMFAGQSHAQIDPDTILGIWLLDEGAGDIAEDASGNGNDGTLMGAPNWVAGQSGNALEFTGSSTYVDCGTADALNVNVFSVSFWCNFPDTQGWNHIVSRGSHRGGGTPGAVNWGVMMVSAEPIILFEAFNDTGWNGLRANSTAGEWHHVVATYDGDTMQLYHDGALAAETSGAGMLLDETRPLLIGARSHDSPASFFDGSVDEVGYFNAILSPEDIQTIMDNGLAGIGGGQPLARRPDPTDGALLEQTWGSLSWSTGDFAVSHDVYLGENFDDVNDGAADTFVGNQASTTLIVGFAGFPFPDGLVPGKTYHWRIDEVNDANAASPWKGDVWSFSIPSKTSHNPVPGDGAKFIETDGVTLGWTPGFGAKLHTVYFGDNFDDINSGAGGLPQSAASFTPAGPLEVEKTYYWRVDEFDAAETHKGPVWSFTTAGLGGGIKGRYFQGMNFETLVATRVDPQIDFNWGDPGGPDPAAGDDQFSARWAGEVEAAFTETYTFYTNSDDGVRLWIGGQQLVNNWTNHAPTENKGTVDLVAGNTYSLQMEYYEDGGGAVAELRWSSPRTPKQLVPSAALSLPIKAGTPRPANGAAGTSLTPILTWNPGDNAASHEVYFGTDADAVANATKASPEFKATKALGAESYDPGKLAWDTTYYWRVDQINNANPDSPWVGNVWSFRTGDFLIVDDFESYDDIDPLGGEPAGNRIFDKWIDGFGTTTNGALVGNDFPPYAEQTIVHSGAQSMIYRYDNAGKTSEATLTLVYPRDWTTEGVTKLSLWFNGNSANAADRIFVAAGGSAAVYHDAASATQLTGWNEWVIDLAGFGIDLTNVNTITIGIGTKNAPAPGGGAGTMYFDDIRLIR